MERLLVLLRIGSSKSSTDNDGALVLVWFKEVRAEDADAWAITSLTRSLLELERRCDADAGLLLRMGLAPVKVLAESKLVDVPILL